ncbi:hypothetical protein Slin15195_G025040 [Septoria linicola]|uniref:Uncharacterized protein n=1 Tax=Septoria linicola TaxID=215465 RepID=A0A9Q9EFP8_9PEZI|nr:hypothetical protein Slin14017_G024130 [Septoria linicola]USW49185.1 hypothetical protein Slin15195_G025040 [Septoria linicola]
MAFDNSSDPVFRPLSYEDGVREIDAFYPSPGCDPYSTAHHTVPAGASGRGGIADGQILEMTQDAESAELTSKFGSTVEIASSSERQIKQNKSAPSAYNKATPPQSCDEANRYRIVKDQTPCLHTLHMEGTMRGSAADALSGSPIPPSSSNRGELQAEMRDEEEDQPARISGLAPVPFSLSKSKGGVDRKREASASPLAVKRPAPKKAKSGDDEAIPSSPPLFAGIPCKALAAGKSFSLEDLQDDNHQEPNTDAGQQRIEGDRPAPHPATDVRRSRTRSASLSIGAEESDNLQIAMLPRDTTPAESGVVVQPEHEAGTESAEEGIIDKHETTSDDVPGAVTKARPTRHRRPMGSSELKDLIGKDVLRGVHANMSPQRMTRHQKQEREASKPGASAREAVKRRRQSSGKDAK